MEKAVFLANLDAERARWDVALAEVERAHMSLPSAAGEWSVKDLIAHVTWFEREMVDLLRDRALAGSDLWMLPQDKRNAAIYAENRDRPLDDVLAEARRVYPGLRDLLASIMDKELTDPGCFRDMPSDWVPWRLLAENTYEHYLAHLPALRAAATQHD